MMKNSRGICPLDLAPELRKLQESCIENLFHCAMNGSEGIIHQEQDKVPKAVSAVAAVTMKQHKRLHVDNGSALNYGKPICITRLGYKGMGILKKYKK